MPLINPLLPWQQVSKLFEIIPAHLPDAHCFADDTQLYLSFKPNSPRDQAEAVCAMEKCISDLRNWMYKDKVKINDDKTEFLIIGSKQQLLKINTCTVLMSVGTLDHIAPVLQELHWLPIRHRIHFEMLLLTFKALNGVALAYDSDLINGRKHTHYSLRSYSGTIILYPRKMKKSLVIGLLV